MLFCAVSMAGGKLREGCMILAAGPEEWFSPPVAGREEKGGDRGRGALTAHVSLPLAETGGSASRTPRRLPKMWSEVSSSRFVYRNVVEERRLFAYNKIVSIFGIVRRETFWQEGDLM